MDKFAEKKKIIYAVYTILFAAFSLFCEGGIYLMPLAFVWKIFYYSERIKIGFLVVFSIILFSRVVIGFNPESGVSLYSMLMFSSQWAMVIASIFIHLYNGKIGYRGNFGKYIFYVVYPLHLWILMVISYMFIS